MISVAEKTMVIDTLYSMRNEPGPLKIIGSRLREEWGAFAPKDMSELYLMATNAGDITYVGRELYNGIPCSPLIVLQTARADVHGNWERLAGKWSSYNEITSNETWRGHPSMSGDTAVFLQITTLDEECRSSGVGRAFRDGVLARLKKEKVECALTTTPIPREFYEALASRGSLEGVTPDELDFPPAAKFHYSGGGQIVGIARDYKALPEARLRFGTGRQLNADVAFIRYLRGYDGKWQGNAGSENHFTIAIDSRILPLVYY